MNMNEIEKMQAEYSRLSNLKENLDNRWNEIEKQLRSVEPSNPYRRDLLDSQEKILKEIHSIEDFICDNHDYFYPKIE